MRLYHQHLHRWTSLFFYLLTGEIRFAPLKSQGLEYRSQRILENVMPGGSPAPCSPKTIYLLAKRVNQSCSYISNHFCIMNTPSMHSSNGKRVPDQHFVTSRSKTSRQNSQRRTLQLRLSLFSRLGTYRTGLILFSAS
jgi:hypothetical protein